MTTDPRGWPDPARPGYPANPERDGWHWIKPARGIGITSPRLWHARIARWEMLDGTLSFATEAAEMWRYVAPCITPDEVAACEAAAAAEMREAAAQHLFTLSASSPRWGSPEEHGEHIRALPLPTPDALTRALAQARAEEREACAKIALRTMLPDDCGPAEAHGRFQQAVACCEAIRARGKEKMEDE